MKAKYLPLLLLLLAFQGITAQVKPNGKGTKVEASTKVDLEVYKGSYTSEQDPDGILIYVQGDKLMGKVPQQPLITFDHTGKHLFKSEKNGIILEFSADKKQLALKRKDGTLLLTRK